ncbi:MAG: hypothetical protein ACRDT6_22475, partial [Micromonosporaceae bacterium]
MAIAGAVVLLALRTAGVLPGLPPPGLPDPGAVTRWGLPVVTVLARLAAVATVGSLLAAAFLVPGLTDTAKPTRPDRAAGSGGAVGSDDAAGSEAAAEPGDADGAAGAGR